jgi:hypothetical protein
LGENTYTALRRLAHAIHVGVPAQIRDQIVRPLVARLERTLGQVRAQAHLLAHRLDVAGARVAHLAHALPHEIALVGERVGITAKQLRREARRLSRLEKATVGLGAVALVAAALGRLGLGWLRCPSLLRMGRKMGCAGFGWLEGFFATAFEALVVLDLCRFALAAQRLAKELVPQLAGTLLVQNAVCLGGGASYPSAHDSPKTLTRVTLPTAHD